MRKYLGLTIALIAAATFAATTVASHAADLHTPGYKSPVYTPSYYNWTGFYAGINGGYGFGKASVANAVGSTGDFNVTGSQFGGTLGYNLQTGSWVWGLEGDIDYSTVKGSSSSFCVGPCTVSNTWLGTARARLGYAGWDRWLPYITGGAGFGNVKFEQGATSDSKTRLGWTAGLGLEYAFMANWTAKAEYLYTDLGSSTCSAGTCNPTQDVTYKFKTNAVRLGLNYRF